MELTGGADCGATGGDEKSEREEEEVAGGGSVWVERLVRPTTPNGPPEHAARLDFGAIVCAVKTMLTNPKENIQSYCPKTGDGTMDDVDSSLIMKGAEMKQCGKGRNAIL